MKLKLAKRGRKVKHMFRRLLDDLRDYGLVGLISKWIRNWPPTYWLRCHTYNRYHMVDCRNRFYKWGWCDVDFRLLYASFELLRQFIEEEDGLMNLQIQGPAFRDEAEKWLDVMDKTSMELREEMLEQAAERDKIYFEVLDLWAWWTRGRSEDHNLDEDHEKDTEMLIRLMKVRGSLWT